MQIQSRDLNDGQPIDPRFAFGRPDAAARMVLSDNLSPQLSWSGAPSATRSFALLCMDHDVPSEAGAVNQEGQVLPADMPRVSFCHWAMADISVGITELARGACSNGVTIKGKRKPPGPPGSRQGLNDYTGFMSGDAAMAGEYFGYDGPCPPWNDERLHHYEFTVYALDVERLDLPEPFTGHALLEAVEGHVLAKASLTGSYTLNRDLSKPT